MSRSATLPAIPGELGLLTHEVRALEGRAAEVLYALGLLLGRIEQEQLWRQGPFTSFSDYLSRGADVAETTARRSVAVARHFNLEVAKRYGFDKLSRGLRYMELTGRVEQPGDLIAADLRLRGLDGQFVSVPFHEARGWQIDEAIRLELERVRGLSHRSTDDLKARLDRLSEALPDLPGGFRAAKRRVEATKNKKGDVVLTFKQIPLSELKDFLASVERELLDVVEGGS